MKGIIIFAAVLATVSANAVGRSGWGSGSSNPSISIGLDAIAAAVGQGNAQGSQQILELASGSAQTPVVLASTNGLYGSVDQSTVIDQVGIANSGQQTSSSINDVHVGQGAIGIDFLEAYGTGDYVQVANSADTSSTGVGEIGSALNTYNSLVNQGSHRK